MTGFDPEKNRKRSFSIRQRIFRSGWLRPVITMLLFTVLAANLDIEKIIRTFKGFDKSVGVLMFCVNIALIFLFAKRWQIISNVLGFEPSYALLVRTIWLASFLGQFGPTLPIAEATRFQMLKHYAPMGQLLLSQILDRLSGQIALFVLVLVLSPLYSGAFHTTFLKTALLLSGGVLLAVLIFRLIYRKIHALQHSDKAIELLIKPPLSKHYGLSLFIQGFLVLNFSLAAVGFGLGDQLGCLLPLTPLLFAAITLLPITISDWGSRETVATLILASCASDAETIVSVSVLYGLLHLLAALPGGLFLIAHPPPSTEKSFDKP